MKYPPCDICGKPTTIKTAYLSVLNPEVDACSGALAQWEKDYAPNAEDILSVITLSDLAKLPDKAKWYWAHMHCIPDEKELYAISATRINTSAKALEWTLHLMKKTWFSSTDWADAIYELGPSDDDA